MCEICRTCFLFLVALGGGVVGMMLMNTSLAFQLWVCSKMEQDARQRR